MEPFTESDEFEPQIRSRSNTWPLSRRENYVESADDVDTNCIEISVPTPTTRVVPTKKNSRRRNAWGNNSYADLITQAITSSEEKRLTLSQIYDWMIQNVPYFKDKGDSNSSAGWKNSVRHNLSLHNQFMRVQNEATGKSWWVINPDAKSGKHPYVRRRAASMQTGKCEKRRDRVKKKVEALRKESEDPFVRVNSLMDKRLDLCCDSLKYRCLNEQMLQHPRLSHSFSNESFSTNYSSCDLNQHKGMFVGSSKESCTMKKVSTLDMYQPYAVTTLGTISKQYLLNRNDNQQLTLSNQSQIAQQSNHYTPFMVTSQPITNANASLDDLNINFDTLQGGFECDVNEIINYELSMDGTLDFDFGNSCDDLHRQRATDAALNPQMWETHDDIPPIMLAARFVFEEMIQDSTRSEGNVKIDYGVGRHPSCFATAVG